MSDRTEPLPPALAALSRSIWDETLSPEEFGRRAAEPISAGERADIEQLITWFTHRYPTAAARLQYARRRFKHTIPALTRQPSKVIDFANFVASRLPKLTEVSGIVESGPFLGAKIRMSAAPGDFVLEPSTNEQYVMNVLEMSETDLAFLCGGHRFVVARALFFSRTGARMSGGGVSVSMFSLDSTSARPKKFLRQIGLPKTLEGIVFPAVIEDAGGRHQSRSYLPLPGDIVPLDIYYLHAEAPAIGPALIMESTADMSSRAEFDDIADTAWSLFSYFTGEAVSGTSCDIGLDSDGNVVEADWSNGRVGEAHVYGGAIPVGYSEWYRAREALGWSEDRPPLNGPTFARCLKTLLAHEDLRFAMFYLLTALSVPLEMRGALLSVALETATKFDEPSVEEILSPAEWAPLKTDLLAAVAGQVLPSGPSKPALEKKLELIRARIESSLNRGSNKNALLAPFERLEIALTDGERRAIANRDRYLHRGRIGRNPDQAEWRDLHRAELALYTAINKLVLTRLGYRGPIRDWGSGETEGATSFAIV